VIVLVIYGVAASISMIVLGWPEQTPAQVALLELAALPLQAAVAVGLWYLSRRMRPLGSRGRLAWWIAIGVAAVGLALVGVAYLGPHGLVHPGLALVWLAVLIAMVLVVATFPAARCARCSASFRRRRTRASTCWTTRTRRRSRFSTPTPSSRASNPGSRPGPPRASPGRPTPGPDPSPSPGDRPGRIDRVAA